MSKTCSAPWCTRKAEWTVTAQTPSIEGSVFLTCDKHVLESDEREPLSSNASNDE